MRWEYRWSSTSIEELDQLGHEGWEAVGVYSDSGSDIEHSNSAVLMKRCKDVLPESS